MVAITVQGVERGYYPTNLPFQDHKNAIAHLDIVITPIQPLAIGQRVQLHTLVEQPPHPLPEAEYTPPRYTSHNSDIAGRIIGVRALEKSMVEFVVKNEIGWSNIAFAYLAIQAIQGVTVNLSLWHRSLLTLAEWRWLPSLETRWVPIEGDAIVIKRDTYPPMRHYLSQGERRTYRGWVVRRHLTESAETNGWEIDVFSGGIEGRGRRAHLD